MNQPRPLIYLAGPGVFREDFQQYGVDLRRQCNALGMEGLWPGDAYSAAQSSPQAVAKQLYRANVAMIDRATAVVAEISPFRGPNMDPGTAFEIGYATAKDIPVYAWSKDSRSLLQRTFDLGCCALANVPCFRDHDGLQVEDFSLPENLMTACPVNGVYRSVQEALAEAASDLAPLQLHGLGKPGASDGVTMT